MLKVLKILKKIPIDLGQYEMREETKGKLIAFSLVKYGQGKKALDLGCRDGYWTKRIESKGYSVVSADIEPSHDKAIMIDANKKLPFTENSFDLVWCSEVLEHLSDPAFSVSEMRRILKPEGRIILTTPNSHFWLFKFFRLFGIHPAKLQNKTHTQFFSMTDIKKLFPDAKIYGFFPYLVFKLKISNPASVSFLSPTFVICYEKK